MAFDADAVHAHIDTAARVGGPKGEPVAMSDWFVRMLILEAKLAYTQGKSDALEGAIAILKDAGQTYHPAG
jgi:hypothetical protein